MNKPIITLTEPVVVPYETTNTIGRVLEVMTQISEMPRIYLVREFQYTADNGDLLPDWGGHYIWAKPILNGKWELTHIHAKYFKHPSVMRSGVIGHIRLQETNK